MKRHVAVIEDDPDTVQLLSDILTPAGYTVVSLEEVVQSIPKGGTASPLFLIDVMLSGTSGIEMAGRLRRAGFATTPMVAVSASELMLRVAADSGLFQDTLAKPLDIPSLLDVVDRHTDSRGPMQTGTA